MLFNYFSKLELLFTFKTGKSLTYINHKKKYINIMEHRLFKENEQNQFLKFTKYIYLKKNTKKGVVKFINYNLLTPDNSAIENTFGEVSIDFFSKFIF